LRNEISRLNIEIIQANITNISFENPYYSVELPGNKRISGKSVVVATGGQAAPVFGSDGSGYNLLVKMGHKLNNTYPALVQLRTSFTDIKSLNGVRAYAGIKLCCNGSVIAQEEGELQFTNYGVSGIPALNVSGRAGQGSEIEIDFSPDTDYTELLHLLEQRANNLSASTAEQFFTGFFHKAIGRILLKYADIPHSFLISSFTENEFKNLMKVIKSFRMPLTGVLGFAEAQATGGGISTVDFNPRTMESVINKGLYAAGEVLDIYGPCGGYNLQWAWASGFLAGISASRHMQCI
jgi:predicted Rossmann fold flavoprotein